jgi:hypothetical protein
LSAKDLARIVVRRGPKDFLTMPLVVAAALAFLIEEVLWAWVSRLMAYIGRWPPITRLETVIRRLPPYAAVALFILPWLVILPVKLGALWLVGSGHILTGATLFAAGEVFGVGLLARFTMLCLPTLRRLAWFVRVEGLVLDVSAWAHAWLERLALWRAMKILAERLRLALQTESAGWLARRLRAAHRLVKVSTPR